MDSEIGRVQVSILSQFYPVEHACSRRVGKAARACRFQPRPECRAKRLEWASATRVFPRPSERFGSSICCKAEIIGHAEGALNAIAINPALL
jgi:hypothetical protein